MSFVVASLNLFTMPGFVCFPVPLSLICVHLPFLLPSCRALIDKDVSIPPETFHKHVDTSLTYINQALKQISRLFLVEDLVDSLKVSSYMFTSAYESLATLNFND